MDKPEDDDVVAWFLWAMLNPEAALDQLERGDESPTVKAWLDEDDSSTVH